MMAGKLKFYRGRVESIHSQGFDITRIDSNARLALTCIFFILGPRAFQVVHEFLVCLS